jgi:hypothetical protein
MERLLRGVYIEPSEYARNDTGDKMNHHLFRSSR